MCRMCNQSSKKNMCRKDKASMDMLLEQEKDGVEKAMETMDKAPFMHRHSRYDLAASVFKYIDSPFHSVKLSIANYHRLYYEYRSIHMISMPDFKIFLNKLLISNSSDLFKFLNKYKEEHLTVWLDYNTHIPMFIETYLKEHELNHELTMESYINDRETKEENDVTSLIIKSFLESARSLFNSGEWKELKNKYQSTAIHNNIKKDKIEEEQFKDINGHRIGSFNLVMSQIIRYCFFDIHSDQKWKVASLARVSWTFFKEISSLLNNNITPWLKLYAPVSLTPKYCLFVKPPQSLDYRSSIRHISLSQVSKTLSNVSYLSVTTEDQVFYCLNAYRAPDAPLIKTWNASYLLLAPENQDMLPVYQQQFPNISIYAYTIYLPPMINLRVLIIKSLYISIETAYEEMLYHMVSKSHDLDKSTDYVGLEYFEVHLETPPFIINESCGFDLITQAVHQNSNTLKHVILYLGRTYSLLGYIVSFTRIMAEKYPHIKFIIYRDEYFTSDYSIKCRESHLNYRFQLSPEEVQERKEKKEEKIRIKEERRKQREEEKEKKRLNELELQKMKGESSPQEDGDESKKETVDGKEEEDESESESESESSEESDDEDEDADALVAKNPRFEFNRDIYDDWNVCEELEKLDIAPAEEDSITDTDLKKKLQKVRIEKILSEMVNLHVTLLPTHIPNIKDHLYEYTIYH